MAAERIVGVDFGTSTSVIRVKRYQEDGQPVGDPLETKPVTFNMGNPMVPTLIEKLSIGDVYFGHEAESGHRNAKTFQNFKVDIENPDEDVQRQARELTAEYFAYLAKNYRAQSEGGHLGEADDRQRTIISYPVKWSDEARDFLVRTAKEAGFPNVEGVDEAQAAIQSVTVQNADLLTHKGYFQDGVPVNILLIDMGAGTTDLVLCRHTPGEQPKTYTLCTWPKGGNVLFGGREVDKLLNGYIRRLIPKESWDQVHKRVGIEQYKSWKEKIVSPALQRMRTIDEFTALDNRLEDLEIQIKYAIDRDIFEDFAADYLRQFPELVNGCVSAAGLKGDDVDLVILTGGHSQWYFAREMLSGKLKRFGKISLKKIKADPERIISISLPQETVALGLAYMPLKVDIQPKYEVRPVLMDGGSQTVDPKKDGPAIVLGWNYNDFRYDYNASEWQDIVAIAAGLSHTVGLKRDGTVIAVGENTYGQCNVNNWWNIVAIAAGRSHTVGLKNDGTVIEVGDVTNGIFYYLHQARYGGGDNIVGRVLVATRSYSDMLEYKVHAKSLDRPVGNPFGGYGQPVPFSVDHQDDIVAIAAGALHTVCLRKDGTVIAVGENAYGQCNVNGWQDIVAITAGAYHTVCLRKDGAVIAVGANAEGQCNVNGWRDIVAIAAGYDCTVGLKKDGTVVTVGNDDYNSVDVFKYTVMDGEHIALGFLPKPKIKKLLRQF